MVFMQRGSEKTVVGFTEGEVEGWVGSVFLGSGRREGGGRLRMWGCGLGRSGGGSSVDRLNVAKQCLKIQFSMEFDNRGGPVEAGEHGRKSPAEGCNVRRGGETNEAGEGGGGKERGGSNSVKMRGEEKEENYNFDLESSHRPAHLRGEAGRYRKKKEVGGAQLKVYKDRLREQKGETCAKPAKLALVMKQVFN